MKEQKPFYIGWQDSMDSGTGQFLRRRLLIVAASSFLVVFVAVLCQKAFNAHVFELGKLTELSGTYYDNPVPMVVADANSLPAGLSTSVLLVGYGKFGAEGIMSNIETETGPLNGRQLTLKGTLIHGSGKTLMELTRKEKSLMNVEPGSGESQILTSQRQPVLLQGEILDPKCYFGVMKPGEGKIHRSCAIRCISGGIPPVFRHESGNSQRPYEYFILLGPRGEKINDDILSLVAEYVSVSGQVGTFGDWSVVYTDPADIANIE